MDMIAKMSALLELGYAEDNGLLDLAGSEITIEEVRRFEGLKIFSPKIMLYLWGRKDLGCPFKLVEEYNAVGHSNMNEIFLLICGGVSPDVVRRYREVLGMSFV